MGLGKQNRLNRLFAHPSRRLCSVAVDHFIGYQEGLPAGLRDLPAAIDAIVAGRRAHRAAIWPTIFAVNNEVCTTSGSNRRIYARTRFTASGQFRDADAE